MNIEDIRNYCIAKKGVSEEFPFDDTTLVFKVMGKMFALTSLKTASTINLKCDPEYAVELREQYIEITAGYHMSKKHWNTVSYIQGLSANFIFELIDHSYDLVTGGLTKKLQLQLQNIKEG